ncbi:MAG: MBL fold metallo-hydrolase [Thermoguttaceae bacterium]|nr:MBL fold metallo-hydrolase [Thermoguttaceae bacterium]
MQIRFLGANGQVTGARHLLVMNGFRVLIDCGMVQERDFQDRNWQDFPDDATQLDAVILTHAHLDHTGWLPRLVKFGFNGPIYATHATAELTELVLRDSAHIQEEDVAFKIKRHKKEGRKSPHPDQPLYTQDDVEQTIPMLRPADYHREIQLRSGDHPITAKFYEAGHLLGSAFVEITEQTDSGVKRVIFSGDLGKKDRPILRDIEYFTDATKSVDAVITESTYGDRVQDETETVDEQLAKIICKTVRRDGKVIAPVFAIERAQEVLYRLSLLRRDNRIPSVPIYLDSPMAVEATKIFTRHPECFDDKTRQLLESGYDFRLPEMQFLRTAQESMKLNTMSGPAIILSSAGMCNAGRIKHHLANHIGNKKNTIMFLGYQAIGTLGRTISECPKSVRILGAIYPVRAEIGSVHGISGHADRGELLRWMEAIPQKPHKIFVIHGEASASQSLADEFHRVYPQTTVTVPKYGETFEVA